MLAIRKEMAFIDDYIVVPFFIFLVSVVFMWFRVLCWKKVSYHLWYPDLVLFPLTIRSYKQYTNEKYGRTGLLFYVSIVTGSILLLYLVFGFAELIHSFVRYVWHYIV